jgi:ribA/ribD-fused uncharacterized protein
MTIQRFEHEYRFLSNFWPGEVVLGGLPFPTAEHAYQASKSRELYVRAQVADLPSPGGAKRFGQKIELRPDWERVKKQVMLTVVVAKFTQHRDLADLLVATGTRRLVEGNTWHDNYWGSCCCAKCAEADRQEYWADRGLNYLGKMLMTVRDVVRID